MCKRYSAAPKIGADHIDSLANKIETMLDNASQNDRFRSYGSANRWSLCCHAAFPAHGRAQTLSFFEDCIQTVELCDDLPKQMDDDF